MSDAVVSKTPESKQIDRSRGWSLAKFGDVARKVNEKVDRENCDLDRYVAGGHMQTDDFHIKEWGTICDDYLGPAFNQKFVKGQILYGSRRTYLRKVAIAHFDGICANTTFVIEQKGNGLIPELLPFIMQSESFTAHSVKMSKGSTNPYINWKDIACYEFSIPPKDQQPHIAEILWAAEDCIVKNERFVEVAERYKRVLMRELFSRGIGHTKYKDVKTIGRIPVEWDLTQVQSTCEKITVGIVIKPASYYVPDGIPAFRSLNIQEDRLSLEDLVHISPMDNDTKLSKSKLKKGDVLIVRTGYPGTSCVVPEDFEGSNCIDLIIARPNKSIILNEFLSRFFNSNLGKNQVTAMETGLAQKHLNINAVKKVLIPLPPLPEQRDIASILSHLDDTIALARETVAATRAIKMKLINQLLSGEVTA